MVSLVWYIGLVFGIGFIVVVMCVCVLGGLMLVLDLMNVLG